MKMKTLVGLSGFRIANSMRNGIIYAFLGIYLRENLLLSVTETNLLFTLMEFTSAITQFALWGWVSDRYNARNSLIVLGETVAASGYIFIYLFHKGALNAGQMHKAGLILVFGIAALEIFWSAGFTGFYSLLAQISNAETRLQYLGASMTLMGIGRIAGTFIGGALFDYKGIPGGGFQEGLLFYLLCPMILSFALLSHLTVKDKDLRLPWRRKAVDTKTPKEDEAPQPDLERSGRKMRWKGRNRLLFWGIIGGLVVAGFGRGGVQQIMVLYFRLADTFAISSVDLSFIQTAQWIGLMLVGPFCSKVIDRFRAGPVFLICYGWLTLLPLIYIYCGSVMQLVILYFTRGVGMALSSTSVFQIIVTLIPRARRGRLLSQYNASRSMAWGLGGSMMGGPIADYGIAQGASISSAYVATIWICSSLSLLGFAFIIVFTLRAVGDITKTEKRDKLKQASSS